MWFPPYNLKFNENVLYKAEQNVRNIRAIEKDPSKIQNMSAINLYKLSKVLHCSMETLLEL